MSKANVLLIVIPLMFYIGFISWISGYGYGMRHANTYYHEHPPTSIGVTTQWSSVGAIVVDGHSIACGHNGNWWPARMDGQCYLVDEPGGAK